MDELGHILREAREARGLTLAQVQEKIRINVRFLDALETGKYEQLPTPVHIRGYLRNYARFLELDPKPLLDRVVLVSSQAHSTAGPSHGNTTKLPSLGPWSEDQPFFVPVDVALGESRRDPDSTMRLVIIAALLVALALVGNRFVPLLMGKGDGSQALGNNLVEAVNSVINSANGSDQQVDAARPSAEAILTPVGEPIINTGVNMITALPSPAPTRRLMLELADAIELRLEITERSWVEVTIDGTVVHSGQVVRGDGPFEWKASHEARFRTGNGAGVYVTINDNELGKLGGRGQVVDEKWSTTGN
jgi:transcriptional regulator with XRE-family HTH domain